MALKLTRYPIDGKILRSKAKPILKVTDATRKLVSEMIELMHEQQGVGLAAPQVGKLIRLFVWDVGAGARCLINPEPLAYSGATIEEEGCLSIPSIRGYVQRFESISMSGIDERGRRVRVDAVGLEARVMQHEFDHLNGVLFIDRMIANPAEAGFSNERQAPDVNEEIEETNHAPA